VSVHGSLEKAHDFEADDSFGSGVQPQNHAIVHLDSKRFSGFAERAIEDVCFGEKGKVHFIVRVFDHKVSPLCLRNLNRADEGVGPGGPPYQSLQKSKKRSQASAGVPTRQAEACATLEQRYVVF
jgi:hypothetical protein